MKPKTQPRRSASQRLLAIDPGTRHIGLAVFEGKRLIYRGVETVPSHPSPRQRLIHARRIVLRLVRDFSPSTVAVEKAFFASNGSTALLNVLVDEIQALATRRRIRFVSFAPSTVKRAVTGNGRARKWEVARAVVARYPELTVFIGQDRKWKARYHSNMFDAVAIGLTAKQGPPITMRVAR